MKNFLTISFLFVNVLIAFSQNIPPHIVWDRNYGGYLEDYANSFIITSDSGYAILGTTLSGDGDIKHLHDKSNGPFSPGDFWLIKTTRDGKIQWQKTYGGESKDCGYSICAAFDGGFMLYGYTQSDSGDITNKHGGADLWVVKTDKKGNIIWQKTYGGSLDDFVYRRGKIIATPDSCFIVLGGSSSWDGDIKFSYSMDDAFVFKIDSTGNILWRRTLGGQNNDYLYNITFCKADTSYILVGETNSPGDDIKNYHGGVDAWLVKINNQGKLLWSKTYGGKLNDMFYDITTDYNGDLIAVGNTYSTDSGMLKLKGLSDIWIVKTDKEGYIIWQKTYGSSDDDYANAIGNTSDSGYVITGNANKNDSDLKSITNKGCWVFKLNKYGELKWQQDVSTHFTKLTQITALENNSYFSVGNTLIDRKNFVRNDVYLTYLSDTGTTSINEPSNTLTRTLHLYPNPATNTLSIELPQSTGQGIADIKDMQGRSIVQMVIGTTPTQIIDISTLSRGMYIISIKNEEGFWAGKFVKE